MNRKKNFENYYVWTYHHLMAQFKTTRWKSHFQDTWFLYAESASQVTKTECISLEDVKQHIFKTFPGKNKKIIPAAPNNLLALPEVIRLDYNQTVNVKGLNFAGLQEKQIMYIESYQNVDLDEGENLFIDISYKMIIKEVKTGIGVQRRYLGELRRAKLEEFQSRFPNLIFKSSIISYLSYDLNPACFRSFEELLDDYEREEFDYMERDYLDQQFRDVD